jgi:hypothetical protein
MMLIPMLVVFLVLIGTKVVLTIKGNIYESQREMALRCQMLKVLQPDGWKEEYLSLYLSRKYPRWAI